MFGGAYFRRDCIGGYSKGTAFWALSYVTLFNITVLFFIVLVLLFIIFTIMLLLCYYYVIIMLLLCYNYVIIMLLYSSYRFSICFKSVYGLKLAYYWAHYHINEF